MASQLSVIIVAYNSNDVLLPCLESLERYNPLQKELEVIVVDNLPAAGLEALLKARDWNFTCRYRPDESNGGFGAGNNRGVELATAPVVLFLNPDTLLTEDIVVPTLECIRLHPDEVVGYTLTDQEGKPNHSYSYLPEYLFFYPLFNLLQRMTGGKAAANWRWLNRLVWPWGAAFALRKQAFVNAGCFDEKIFLCNEEPDLMRRLPRRHITLLPQKIIHLEGHGREVSVARYAAYLESLDYYLKKYRVRGYSFFWSWLALKLRVRRWLRGNRANNLDRAYEQMKRG